MSAHVATGSENRQLGHGGGPLRPDLQQVAAWIGQGTRVLDLGCGDGALLDWLGHDGAGFPFSGDERFLLRPGCAFAGNPGRFRTGLQTLSPDEEWRSAMPAGRRLLLEALTAPELRRYGYAAAVPVGKPA